MPTNHIGTCINEENLQGKIYLPALDDGIDVKQYLYRYTNREFPTASEAATVVYSVPKFYQKSGERQAGLAEKEVFQRLHGLPQRSESLWVTFFHSACYAGHSFRNQRVGKLMIREHDFVIFARFKEKFFIALFEVKSTNDINTKKDDLEKTSDAKLIKNNKRSAQHQLRDHLEVLQSILNLNSDAKIIQCYIMWPFLGGYTKDPRQQIIKRWKEDKNLHAFEDTLSDQDRFNEWFLGNVVEGNGIEEKYFVTLLNRYIILSCGVFVDEIQQGLVALLTQEQLHLLNSDVCKVESGGPLVVHGAAGTGKTLLVLRKLQQLHQTGQLNEHNRALYICYWPGIRCDIELKMKKLGISDYVDTTRFFITMSKFLCTNKKNYKHIFMDESEALCLAFTAEVVEHTLSTIYRKYHDGNCSVKDCKYSNLEKSVDMAKMIRNHKQKNWGELWFMVDINQASMFLPKHSPQILKASNIVLSKVMRSTANIFNVFKEFYKEPMPMLPKAIMANMNIPNISVGHHIAGPPIYWVSNDSSIDQTIANVIIDLCSTKGFKPHDLCVLPFLVNERLVPESINKHIDEQFVENGYRPRAIKDVEHFLKSNELNDFLCTWVLRVKGLEFKVVIMAIENDDFDTRDSEDRKKAYIMASRCTCMLILVCNEIIKETIDFGRVTKRYPFSLRFETESESYSEKNIT